MANFPIPPTYANPMVEDPVTHQYSFSPLWLNWFLQVAQQLTNQPTGISATITTAMLTPSTGHQGSMTFQNGILTAETQAN